MKANLSDSEFLLLKKFIEEKCGIFISEDKSYFLEARLSKLLIDSHCDSFEEMYRLMVNNTDPQLSEKVIDAITTNETFWFRDKTPWEILEKVFLPVYVEQIRSLKKFKIKIWSCASSTGQESYSTAMCIDNYLNKNNITDVTLGNFEILATDISQAVLDISKIGRYDSITIMRGLDPLYKNKYFTQVDGIWEINDKIKNAVKFQKFNLQNSYDMFGKFDIIFCRYVLIYFLDPLKKIIIRKIQDALNDDGALFIGASEILYNEENYFESFSLDRGIYYKKRGLGI